MGLNQRRSPPNNKMLMNRYKNYSKIIIKMMDKYIFQIYNSVQMYFSNIKKKPIFNIR